MSLRPEVRKEGVRCLEEGSESPSVSPVICSSRVDNVRFHLGNKFITLITKVIFSSPKLHEKSLEREAYSLVSSWPRSAGQARLESL